MTNYEYIISSLKIGKHVVVQNKDTYYLIISPFKGLSGYRGSNYAETIDEAKSIIGYTYYSSEELKDYSNRWKIIETFELEYDTIPEGTAVRIREDAEMWCKKFESGWSLSTKELVGKKCFIKEMEGNEYAVCNEDKSNCQYLPKQALELWRDEEVKEMTVAEVEELVGSKVKIIK